MPVCDFAVRYEIELPGSSPEQVAELVRDQLLNQDAPLVLDILRCAMTKPWENRSHPTSKDGKRGSRVVTLQSSLFRGRTCRC